MLLLGRKETVVGRKECCCWAGGNLLYGSAVVGLGSVFVGWEECCCWVGEVLLLGGGNAVAERGEGSAVVGQGGCCCLAGGDAVLHLYS